MFSEVVDSLLGSPRRSGSDVVPAKSGTLPVIEDGDPLPAIRGDKVLSARVFAGTAQHTKQIFSPANGAGVAKGAIGSLSTVSVGVKSQLKRTRLVNGVVAIPEDVAKGSEGRPDRGQCGGKDKTYKIKSMKTYPRSKQLPGSVFASNGAHR